jgi:hypothetical protein
LRAWGVHQNLFASGEAVPTDDPDAVAAALAHPEIPLKQAVGSNDPFGLEARLPGLPRGPKRTPPTEAAPNRSRNDPQGPADRAAFDAAERALRELDGARKHEEADLQRRQDRLNAQRDAAQTAYVADRKAATAAVAEGAPEGWRRGLKVKQPSGSHDRAKTTLTPFFTSRTQATESSNANPL